MVTENPKQCTHVVAPAISRTMKFFIAVNVCKYVVTKEWLEDSMAKNRFAGNSKCYLKKKGVCTINNKLRLTFLIAVSKFFFKLSIF